MKSQFMDESWTNLCVYFWKQTLKYNNVAMQEHIG